MAFQTAVKTDLRNEILRTLRQDIVFQCSPNDQNAPISASAIILQKTDAQINREDVISNQLTDLPGLLLCSPRKMEVPSNSGLNNKDTWIYNWMIQLIDADLWSNTDRLDSWERWIEQIISAFNFNQMNSVIPLTKGDVLCSFASGVHDVDQSMWVRDGKFVSGVHIEVQVLQKRGIV